MTREELKRHCLKQIEGCEMWARHNGGEPHGKVYEEHKLILELLEQEPCSDAISRQAALDKKELVELEDGQSFYCISPEDVETLPPVTPQPKTGRWIMHERLRECSWCGVFLMKDMPRNSYCPNCGTRMIESQERSKNSEENEQG